MRFDVEPGSGAIPIRFGMKRDEVRQLLGPPESSSTLWDKSGTNDNWYRSCVNVGYDNNGIVNHVGFCPGAYELRFRGLLVWSPQAHPDPNPVFLRADPAPGERLGFLVFDAVQVTTTGFHDDDDSQRAITVYPPGKWDEQLAQANQPDLSRYAIGIHAPLGGYG